MTQNTEELTLGIYVPSYKRYDAIKTLHLFEYCTYVVRKSEEEKYRQAGVENILAVEDQEIDSAMKVVEYIIKNTPEDIVFIADDDIADMTYRMDDTTALEKDKDKITAEVERIAQLMVDLKVGYGCVDATPVPYGYDAEFAFKGTSGSMKWVNKSVFKAKLDKTVPYNWDIDMVLQELLHNRIVLKPRYICDKAIGDVNKGGDSEKKWQQRIDSITNMHLKWGRYFDYNFKNNRPYVKLGDKETLKKL